MREHFINILIFSFLLVILTGCTATTIGQYQVYADRAQHLGLNFNTLPPGLMEKKLQERGYVLIDEYRDTAFMTLNGWEKLYVNKKADAGYKYIVTAYQRYGNGRYGWQIIAIDDIVPAEWKGNTKY